MVLTLTHYIGDYVDIRIDKKVIGDFEVCSLSKENERASFAYRRLDDSRKVVCRRLYKISETEAAHPLRDLYPDQISNQHILEILISKRQGIKFPGIRFSYKLSDQIKILRRNAIKREPK